MIAINNRLLKEYLKYQKDVPNIDKVLIVKFFKYYKPFIVSITQLIEIGYDKKTALMLYQNKKIFNTLSSKIVSVDNQTALISQTKFKIMLTDDKNSYPYVNILNDEVDNNYTVSYNSGQSRNKALKHIKNLLLDARYINIVDSYLYENWRENFKILKDILPQSKSIVIYAKFDRYLTTQDKNKLKELKSLKLRVKNYSIKDSNESGLDMRKIHDRYIITDKVVIILSGGINYLLDTSKDFTYVVREK